MTEIIVNIIAGILLLIFVVWANQFVNESKMERCEKDGGVFVLNTSDANMSTCILKGK